MLATTRPSCYHLLQLRTTVLKANKLRKLSGWPIKVHNYGLKINAVKYENSHDAVPVCSSLCAQLCPSHRGGHKLKVGALFKKLRCAPSLLKPFRRLCLTNISALPKFSTQKGLQKYQNSECTINRLINREVSAMVENMLK